MIGTATMLVACSTTPSSPLEPASHDPAKSARIRLYGSNGVGIVFYPGKDSVPSSGDGGIRVSGGFGEAFASFIGASSNRGIGMPQSRRSQEMSTAFLAKEYYQEYTVAADQPVALSMALIGAPYVPPPIIAGVPVMVRTITGCSSIEGSFVPQPGRDYDVYLSVEGTRCIGVVEDIGQGGASLTLHPRSSP